MYRMITLIFWTAAHGLSSRDLRIRNRNWISEKTIARVFLKMLKSARRINEFGHLKRFVMMMMMMMMMMMCGVLSEFLHYVAEPSTRTGDCQ